ncbi:hypothetical protein TNCV_3954711 [Trichonephila clavipes]|nr:hypothetical protein TNCV_3954711 [Trichonephila clavipes]
MEAVEMSKDKSWEIWDENPSWVPKAPRKDAAARFRLLTGHDCMRSYFCQIGTNDPPDYTLCDSGQPVTTEHLNVWLALKGFNCIVEKYWRAHAVMT